jgi:signal transduction histidine kinase
MKDEATVSTPEALRRVAVGGGAANPADGAEADTRLEAGAIPGDAISAVTWGAFVHAIRNPLNGARLHASFLERKLECEGAEDEVLDVLRYIKDEIDSAARLVAELDESARVARTVPPFVSRVQQKTHCVSQEQREDDEHDDHAAEVEHRAETCSGRR